MANNPNRMKDPTEAALSAIQEALNLRDEGEDETERQTADNVVLEALPGRGASASRHASMAPDATDLLDPDAIGTRDLAAAALPAANDDQRSIGISCKRCSAARRRPPTSSPRSFRAPGSSAVSLCPGPISRISTRRSVQGTRRRPS